MGFGFWGGSFGKEGGREGRGKGGLFMDFYVLLTIGWGFLSWFFFSPFLLFFLFGREVCIFVFLFLLFALFFSFSFSFLFCLFSFSDENHQRLASGSISSNHWAGFANAMIVLRIAATFVVPSRSCSFVENWPFTISRARVWKSL